MAAKRVSHQLDAITNAKYWDTLFKDRTVNTRGIVGVNAVGTSGEDNADWLFCDNFLQRRAIGEHLAINGTSVSYTHLDVYKRQVYTSVKNRLKQVGIYSLKSIVDVASTVASEFISGRLL